MLVKKFAIDYSTCNDAFISAKDELFSLRHLEWFLNVILERSRSAFLFSKTDVPAKSINQPTKLIVNPENLYTGTCISIHVFFLPVYVVLFVLQ